MLVQSALMQAQTPQPAPAPQAPVPSRLLKPTADEPPRLTKFNLDFPGGTPKQLVTAIEKAMGRPLNAIVPEQYADTRLPALRMTEVNAAELFKALESSSLKREAVTTGSSSSGPGGYSSYQVVSTAYGFRSQGPVSDDTVWYFFVEGPVLPPLKPNKTCRFFALTPYLEAGQSVDDITTAIQTGWKMLGDKDTPNISFHKDTKLLIAVGEPGKLETIDAVLKALQPAPTIFTAEQLQRLNSQPVQAQPAAVKSTQPAKPAKTATDAEN